MMSKNRKQLGIIKHTTFEEDKSPSPSRQPKHQMYRREDCDEEDDSPSIKSIKKNNRKAVRKRLRAK